MTIEFISKGFRDILYSPGTKELLQNLSEGIRDSSNESMPTGEGFSSKVYSGGYGGGRYIGNVRADDDAAALEESENLTLTKAVRG